MGALNGFPTVQPAIKIKIKAGVPFPCGDIHTGSTLLGVPFVEGTLQSIEGFEPKLDFKLCGGHDWFRVDADKAHGRATISAIATDDEGRALRTIADSILELNEQTTPLIFGLPGAKDFPFGFAIETMRFECGHEPYKALEHMLFAGSMRFLRENGDLWVDIRLSRIHPGSGCE
ncbi:hypothetical protein GQ53DRAFT_713851 [Thozetella sp. PMI_491]|nr:hypothetical protein GQ53DRAFT_713851 [Thozetella sp. PMI_491]